MFHPQGPTLRELAVQALSSVPRGYDLLAPKFDYTPFRTPDPVLRRRLAQLGRRARPATARWTWAAAPAPPCATCARAAASAAWGWT